MSGLTDTSRAVRLDGHLGRIMLVATATDWSNVVRDRRLDLGMSQSALGAKIGMSRQWVVRFENGNAAVATIDHVTRIADALDLEIDVVGV
ncbi:XRE family transcriptional regulator [Microbacterium sp. MYb54]|nr:XRE family transcriptional regulator [Microbacterium sp. MYb43]PQZ76899.1 XRE family transcriptional regulator [Microbacterium sp. MYb40]PRB23291.1 XRE family transcriptional regulator [Microbacterium sp. MYb54]PRB28195.1 XRE family transcriptional regulator [Microbacterium sp. MYb50]PRB66246.1 XRE family transcriptional regulator [Microbacterium sp. MYb24]PRB72970.1 XRE family transcriptional regulator [Microbacterium sp. MYb32]